MKLGEEPFVIVMPWAALEEEVEIGNARFWPWAKAKADMVEVAARDTIEQYLNCFVDHRGEPVTTVTVCSYRGKEFCCLADSELAEMRGARDALVFSVICPQAVRSIQGSSIGFSSAERFQVIDQQLKRGNTMLYVQAGYNTTLGQFKIHRPLSVGSALLGRPKSTLVNALNGVLADRLSAELRTRLFRSLEWFRLAHVEADQVSELSKIVMMATAFETLLGISVQERDKSMFFAKEVEKRFRTHESVCASPASRKEVLSKAACWGYEFYKLRNDVVHGDDVEPSKALYYIVHGNDVEPSDALCNGVRQKDIADLVFYQLLFHILSENDCMECPPETAAFTAGERADYLLCLDGLDEAQRILGWINIDRVDSIIPLGGTAMDTMIAACDASLSDKPMLASIYDADWRQDKAEELHDLNRRCHVPYGYWAPFLEHTGVIHRGWQSRLEEGVSVLLPKFNSKHRGHIIKRMQGSGSTSAEEEFFLARGFAIEFGRDAIRIPQTFKRPPEFEVIMDARRILVEAKGRVDTQYAAGRRCAEDLLGKMFPPSAELDHDIDLWLKRTIKGTLTKKSLPSNAGLILVVSVYTRVDPLKMIHWVRTAAMDPKTTLEIKEEGQWALGVALVCGGSVFGVWFNSIVRDRLGIATTMQERIREAIKNSFFPHGCGVFFHEEMTTEEHRAEIDRLFRQTASRARGCRQNGEGNAV